MTTTLAPMERTLRSLVLVAAAYVAAQIFSDIASLRIVEVAGWTMDAGTLIYPLTFTLRDLVHKLAGKRVARLLIVTAAVINLAMAAIFWMVATLNPDPETGPQLEFGLVLAPVWRLVMASIVAEVVAEFIDTEVYAAWRRRFADRVQWGRVLSSNLVAIPVDTAIFVVLAFVGDLPTDVVWAIFWTNVLLKLLITVGSIPLIYAVKPAPLAGLDSDDHLVAV